MKHPYESIATRPLRFFQQEIIRLEKEHAFAREALEQRWARAKSKRSSEVVEEVLDGKDLGHHLPPINI